MDYYNKIANLNSVLVVSLPSIYIYQLGPNSKLGRDGRRYGTIPYCMCSNSRGKYLTIPCATDEDATVRVWELSSHIVWTKTNEGEKYKTKTKSKRREDIAPPFTRQRALP